MISIKNVKLKMNFKLTTSNSVSISHYGDHIMTSYQECTFLHLNVSYSLCKITISPEEGLTNPETSDPLLKIKPTQYEKVFLLSFGVLTTLRFI